MNYTLKQLQERVNKLIEQQGEDAQCAAWIYTKEDCVMTDENGEEQEYPCDKHPELAERIFNDVGNNDYIYQVIQECVDEATEEQYMAYQTRTSGGRMNTTTATYQIQVTTDEGHLSFLKFMPTKPKTQKE